MKKIIYFVFAALALVACEPNNGATEKVRIGVSLDDNTQPAKGPQRISAIDGATEIEINWDEDDVLYYQIDEQEIKKNNPFKIVSGVGTKKAFFECDNIENLFEQSFTLYYNPINPQDNKTQQVTINKDGKTVINDKYLTYIAENCEVHQGIKLNPNFTVLGVQLVGDKTDFHHYLAIGTQSEFNGDINDSYICKFATSVDLTTSPTYYFVLPADYELKGRCIRVISRKGHNTNTVDISLNSLNLTVGSATVIKLYLKTVVGDGADDNHQYTLSTTPFNQIDE